MWSVSKWSVRHVKITCLVHRRFISVCQCVKHLSHDSVLAWLWQGEGDSEMWRSNIMFVLCVSVDSVCINETMTYLSVTSFVTYGILWARANALIHRNSPKGQHTAAFPSLTLCWMLFVSSTVTGFSRPHMCPEMDQVENSNPSRHCWPHHERHEYIASSSPTASPLTQTPGKKMGHTGAMESCYSCDEFCFLASLLSCKHCRLCLHPNSLHLFLVV